MCFLVFCIQNLKNALENHQQIAIMLLYIKDNSPNLLWHWMRPRPDFC
jgi:hypothetical protein